MDLKKFISESLVQIAGGISAAQEKMAELNSGVETSSHDVYFDVALTVVEDDGLLVMGLSHFGSASYEQMLSLVSRVKFSVPLSYVHSPKIKFPYLQFNSH